MTISFNAVQEEQIKQALADYLKITDETEQNDFLDAVELTGCLAVFGAGSLLNYSHLHKDSGDLKDANIAQLFPGIDPATLIQVKPATLEGYDKDFVCYDIHYRGTPSAPGITIGLEKKEEVSTAGGVLTTRIDHLNPNVAANFICYYLEQFAAREVPPNMPIYKFEQIPATLSDGTEVKALACVADENGPLYIHNPENDFARNDKLYYIQRGDFERRAYILATAMGRPLKSDGMPKAKGRVTDLDYLRGVIDASIENDVPIDGKFMRLYAMALDIRASMDRNARNRLEAHEFRGIKGHSPRFAQAFMEAAGLHNELTASPANDAAPTREIA